MEKVRVLLLGAAFSADLHMDGYARIKDKADIIAIADKNTDNIKKLAERYGLKKYTAYDSFEEAIDACDCDVVDICLPNFLHYEPAIRALKKGRNVICEKPFATKVEHAQEMVDLAEKMGKHIYYAEDWILCPAIRKAIEMVDAGGIGVPMYIRAREAHSGSHSIFAQKKEYCGGGSMIHLGIHPVGWVLSLKNNEWTELCAMTSGGAESNLIHKGMEGEDWAGAIMRFKDGTMALLEGNFITIGGMEDTIDIYGTQGCMHLDLTFSSPISAFSKTGFDYTIEKADVTTGWSKPAVDEKFNLGYVGEINHFIECCTKDIDAEIGMRGIDGLEALKVMNYIYESSKKGVTIKNPNI